MGTWTKQHISYRDSGDTDTYSFTIPREVEEVETKHGGRGTVHCWTKRGRTVEGLPAGIGACGTGACGSLTLRPVCHTKSQNTCKDS